MSSWWKFTVSYGVVTRAVLPRLADMVGRDNVALAAIGDLAARPYRDGWLRVIPLGEKMPWARSTDAAEIASRAADFAPDVVVYLGDAWMCPGLAGAFPQAKCMYWMPIDCDPVSQRDLDAIVGAEPVAMSRFGLAQLQAAGVPDAAYVPLGVDVNVFQAHDNPRMHRDLARGMVGPGCSHLTVIVAANFQRKCIPAMMESWAEFADGKPGARLYVHTQPSVLSAPAGAPDLYRIAATMGIRDRAFFPVEELPYGEGHPAPFMPAIYSGADAVLNTSAGEGFGLVILEAQATGVPVVCTDFTAMPELVRWGHAVKPADRLWDETVESWRAIPDVHGGAAALGELYDEWSANGGRWPLQHRRAVSAQIHEEYSWDVVRELWAPLVSATYKAHSYMAETGHDGR